MEERKLNLNAPLLSVRKFCMTSASSDRENKKLIANSPRHRQHSLHFQNKADPNLDQITEPVAVPFVWEQIPGRPKDKNGPEPHIPKDGSGIPELPPRRVLDIVKYTSVEKGECQNGVRPRVESYYFSGNLTRQDCSKEEVHNKEDSDSENDDDGYSDALDTLSPTDSCSLNCSVSGLSGYDGPVVKQSGTFSTDPQTLDFMMSRFLPAAKAMALVPPQFASRKKPLAVEQPRQVKRTVSQEKRPPINENQSIIVPHYGQGVEDEESECGEDDYSDPGNLWRKACGLFPRLCFKNSLGILNPPPVMKFRTQTSMSSTCEVKKPKKPYMRSLSPSLKKHDWDAVYKHKFECGGRSPELPVVKDKLIHEENQFAYSSDNQSMGTLSPYRRSYTGRISPYRNEAPQSPFCGTGFLGIPKEAENFRASRLIEHKRGSSKSQELCYHRSSKQWSGPVSPIVEKTLYVDTVNIAHTSYLNSSPSSTKEKAYYLGQDFETSVKSMEAEETESSKSCFQDLKCPSMSTEGGESESRASGSVNTNLSSLSEVMRLCSKADMKECFKFDQGLDQESMSLAIIKVNDDSYLNIGNNQSTNADDSGKSDAGFEQSPLPPPLPNTPSESWLWRTLPSIPSRSSFLQSNLGTQFGIGKRDPKTSSSSTKWETIVKTSNLHHDHVRYSEELISHVPQHSKT